MSKIFETEKDLIREQKAIEFFCSLYDLEYKKLSKFDIDFMIFRKKNKIGFVEVKGRIRNIGIHFLPLSEKKRVKLIDKKLNPIIIWAFNDGIVYGYINNLIGIQKIGGRKKIREGSSNDIELMNYYSIMQNGIIIKYYT